ncbi:GNAT family N-acetyltransferase [Halocatena pleomorpha]|uniref:N-acetyltransferase n=1 Tax=Halocatena pleomorpha TaxID=1785090 RepID=A0A3P3RHD5_9EURY|nr:GNAT family N-acetyltransferase [Halocatena pleomorpha]RRJ32841.1 N-acetyltransferase [Halocatena pleomorpha]
MRTPDIRQATVEDANALAAVYRSAYQENRELGFPASAGSVSPVTVADWIRENEVSVAAIDGEIVGGVRLERETTHRAKLSRFGVHEEYKGDGIGSELLAHAEEQAADRGYTTIRLTTPERHPYLPVFYRNRGYEKTGDHPLDNRSYDEIIMEKQLR